MEKKEIRTQNPECVMFCHEGSFYTFYDVDALIVNKLCGYKIISSGRCPKAGVPLKNETLFARLERDDVSYIVFKKDEGVQRRFNAMNNCYLKLCGEIENDLKSRGIDMLKYFPKPERVVTSTERQVISRLEFLANGSDPYSGAEVIGLSTETVEWLKNLNDKIKSLTKLT